MLTDFADLAVWIMRLAALAGLAWGAWLCFSHTFLPARRERMLELEHFATFALMVVMFSTVGGLLHAS